MTVWFSHNDRNTFIHGFTFNHRCVYNGFENKKKSKKKYAGINFSFVKVRFYPPRLWYKSQLLTNYKLKVTLLKKLSVN